MRSHLYISGSGERKSRVILTCFLLPPQCMTRFQLNAKCVLLTYPQSGDVTKEELLTHLKDLVPDAAIIVSLEAHQDGSPHLHALLQSETPIRTRSPTFFDFRNLHPNVQGARHPEKAYEYVAKDGDYILHGAFRFSSKAKWAKVLSSTSEEEARSIIKEVAPRDYVLSHDRIESYLHKHFKKEEVYSSIWGGHPPTPVMQEWLDQRKVTGA